MVIFGPHQIIIYIIYLVRLVLAGILGAVIGIERQHEHKPAGMRTLALVSLGSALFMIISEELSRQGMADMTRMPAQIITGIGFLGAGSIIRSGESVKGLTTAASIWVVAGIGMAAGGGLYVIALTSTLFTYFILEIITRISKKKE